MKQITLPFTAVFEFHDELNEFLPMSRRGRCNQYLFDKTPSVKDAVEAQGVPHTEVGLITVNHVPIGFGYHCRDTDRFDVYPVNSGVTAEPRVLLRPEPMTCSGFILDVHLGKLARLMRLMGFDTLYRNDYDDPEIVRLSIAENRAVITRDRALLHARVIDYGYCIMSTDATEQLSGVIRRFNLQNSIVPFSRCLACNGKLYPVDKASIITQLEPLTIQFFDTFFRCNDCGKVYWRGSHAEKLEKTVSRFTESESVSEPDK